MKNKYCLLLIGFDGFLLRNIVFISKEGELKRLQKLLYV